MEKTFLLHKGKRKTVADLAIFTLGKKWPLRLQEIHNEITRSGGRRVSMQATHKALSKLVEKKILTKQRLHYELNVDWLEQLNSFSAQAKRTYKNNVAKEKINPRQIRQLESDLITVHDEPILAINFKAYVQATGDSGLRLVKAVENAVNGSGVRVLLIPQVSDLSLVAKKTNLEIFAPFCNTDLPGSHTGALTAEAIKKIGCSGFVLNIFEKKTTLKELESLFGRAQENGLKVFAYVNNFKEAKLISKLKPFAIEFACASSEKKSSDLTKSIAVFKRKSPSTKFLVGGGISSANETKEATALGADGVAIAGGLIKAGNPKKFIKELINGFGRAFYG